MTATPPRIFAAPELAESADTTRPSGPAGCGECPAVALAGQTQAWAGQAPPLCAEDVAAARRMLTHGRYTQLR
ncbi:hypothetical protein OHU34_41040 [Streptomyces sp. NBC_00080]|uniref:hypothetical protein n=1 Tax=Streptomyces sp. NBC_00080 TaxID=2975645 RepID=UPI00324C6D12